MNRMCMYNKEIYVYNERYVYVRNWKEFVAFAPIPPKIYLNFINLKYINYKLKIYCLNFIN